MRHYQSIRALAVDFGIHRTTVSEHLKAKGVWKTPVRLTAGRMAELTRLYERGWSQARVAAHFNVSESMVTRVLKDAGVTSRPVGTSQWLSRKWRS